MNTLLRFLHWTGFSIWIGAQLTMLVWWPVSRGAPLETWAHVWRTLAQVQRWVVSTSAVVATLTGFALTFQLMGRSTEAGGEVWLIGMQASGLLAAILALAVVAPLVNRMGWIGERSLADGAKHPAAEVIARRLAIAGTLTGALILAAMLFGAMSPPLVTGR